MLVTYHTRHARNRRRSHSRSARFPRSAAPVRAPLAAMRVAAAARVLLPSPPHGARVRIRGLTASSHASVDVREDETLDVLGRSHLLAVQARDGYRASVDALALAWRAHARRSLDAPGARIADLGAGSSGAVGLAYAAVARAGATTFYESQRASADRLRRTLDANAVAVERSCGTVEICLVDCGDAVSATSRSGTCDVVLSNPPFFSERREGTTSARAGRSEERRIGRFESTATLDDFCVFAKALLRVNGEFHVVYPARGRDRLEAAMARAFGGVSVEPCFDHPGAPQASLVFACATKRECNDALGAFAVEELPAIALHPRPRESDGNRRYVDEFEAFLSCVAAATV